MESQSVFQPETQDKFFLLNTLPDPVLNLPGAVGVAAAVGLPTSLLLLRAAVGPEIGVRRLHLFKLGLQVFVRFDVGVLDVPKYLGVP